MNETALKRIKIWSTAILCIYVVTLTFYAAPYAKRDFINFSTRKLEAMIVAMNDQPPLESSKAMAPARDVTSIAEQYPASDSDIVRKLLEEQKNGTLR